MNGKKCICIVLDSVGIGALPDAGRFGDEGSHTLLHVMQAGYSLSNLCAMAVSYTHLDVYKRQGVNMADFIKKLKRMAK